ncbi:MAG TPA: hypothetical protein VHM19_05365, partial [Polyangiales bacterium]|nr:hypothetical protein [Polyangiales bacterium]
FSSTEDMIHARAHTRRQEPHCSPRHAPTTPTDNSETLATPHFIDTIDDDLDAGLVMHVGDIH